jgi:hypothetical protein
MNKLLIGALLLVALVTGVDIAVRFFNYGAREAALEVVECVKDPEGCDLDPSDVPDFSPDDKLVPAVFHTPRR